MMCISSYPHSAPLRAHHPLPSQLPITAQIPANHQNNFIYCRGRSLLMICSFIPITFNNHPHLFVKLVYFKSLPPYATPEK